MKKKILCALLAGVLAFQTMPVQAENYEDYYEIAERIAEKHNISLSFVLAVIEHESSFNSYAISSTGDVGLMQINPKYQYERMASLNITDLTEPKQNIEVGCDFLEELFEKYEDPYEVLAYYNAGQTGVDLYEEGIYTDYAVEICERAAVIEEELSKKEARETVLNPLIHQASLGIHQEDYSTEILLEKEKLGNECSNY